LQPLLDLLLEAADQPSHHPAGKAVQQERQQQDPGHPERAREEHLTEVA
jgi:hypothetical protein